jgi:hypothetical protein
LRSAGAASRLYRTLARREAAAAVRCPDSGEEHLEVRGAAPALASAAAVQRLLRRGGFSTFCFPARCAWGTGGAPTQAAAADGEYLQAGRDAARRGLTIARTYLVRDPAQLDDPCYLRMVNEDARAGIEPLYLLDRQLPSHYPRDFGLWDGELYAETCFAAGAAAAGPALAGCRYFRDARQLHDACDLEREVRRVASRCTGLPSEDSLLAESIGEQHRQALALCGKGASGGSCAWYHGSWHLLRACGVVVTPAWHADFYASHLHAIASECIAVRGRARILICGLADYGMLYHLIAAVGPRLLGRCEIDLLDLCEVPLRMARWLAERLRRGPGATVIPLGELHRRDLLAGELPAGGYDLIVSDAFVTRFESLADKARVAAEWCRLLRPGGSVVTTIKFCSYFDEFPPSAMWRRRFVERALERRPGYVPVTELEGLAREYAGRVHSFPFPDAARVRRFLRALAGLELASFRVDGDGSGAISTPFARVVLRRGAVERPAQATRRRTLRPASMSR